MAKNKSHDDSSLTTPSPTPSKPSPPFTASSNRSFLSPNRSNNQAVASSSKPQRGFCKPFFPEDDVILILKALSNYKSFTGEDPTKNYKVFHPSLIGSLSVIPTVKQLRDKVTKMKAKFEENNVLKSINRLTFNSNHEKQVFELSQMFWGQENEVGVNEKGKVVQKPSKLQRLS